jgi:branched-subunit amino acid ABC-type transport system permease component
LRGSAPRRARRRKKLAWTTFWLNNIGVVIMIPSLALVLKFGQPQYIVPLAISEFLALGAMLCFTVSVWQVLLKSTRADRLSFRPAPAE